MYDYLLVGCGLHNATFARKALDVGKKVLIVEKRDHIAGNCYDKRVSSINVHMFGPHQFHCKSREIWDFVNRFAEFNHYRAHIKANFDGKIYSMPPNMMLYYQLWGVQTPEQARQEIEKTRVPCSHPRNLKEMIEDAVGREIYESFYFGYSQKQWGMDPSEIPVGVGKRLPIRFTYNDRWFEDEYEGIPKNGYTAMIANMIDGADVELNVDYLENKELNKRANKVVYTGAIDEFFDYRLGDLEYRTLDFQHETVEGDFQGNAIMNYTHPTDHAFTRVTEHKHFEFLKSDVSIITREYSRAYVPRVGNVPYYPIGNQKNTQLYQEYKTLAARTSVIFAGRLGSYKYLDMDLVIGQAFHLARKELI